MIPKGQAYTMCFDVIKTDGTEDTSTTPTTRTCKDGGNWAVTTNTAVRKTRPGGGPSNAFHITLTASEMDGNVVGLEVTGSGLVTRVYWLHTEDVWTDTRAGYLDEPISSKRAVTLAASDVTGNLPADVVAISGDTTAADNLEAACDGGQYNVGGGAIVAASVTGNLGGNVQGNVQGTVGGVAGNVTGNVQGTVGGVAGNVTGNVQGTVGGVAGNVTGSVNSVTQPVTLTADYNAAKTAAQAGDAMNLTAAAVDAIIDEAVEGSYTLRQALRVILAVLAGKVSGMNSLTPVFRDINDTKDRVTASTDASGNRTSVTLDVT